MPQVDADRSKRKGFGNLIRAAPSEQLYRRCVKRKAHARKRRVVSNPHGLEAKTSRSSAPTGSADFSSSPSPAPSRVASRMS